MPWASKYCTSAGVDAGGRQRLAQHRLLGRAVRHGEAAAAAVLVHRRAADHGEHRVAVGDGVATAASARRMPQPSPRTNPSAAASKVLHRPSGAIIPHRLKQTKASGSSSRLTPPASASVALAGAQALARLVQRDQRRRARRVDGHARALQAQRVGDAPGRGVEGAAGGRVDVEARSAPAELGQLDVLVAW